MKKIKQYYGDYIERNIKQIAERTLLLAEEIPYEDKLMPNIDLIGQVFEDAKYKKEPNLIELFSNLLVSSIDAYRFDYVYPSFSHIISEMSSLEAENMNLFVEKKIKNCQLQKFIWKYL